MGNQGPVCRRGAPLVICQSFTLFKCYPPANLLSVDRFIDKMNSLLTVFDNVACIHVSLRKVSSTVSPSS